VSTAGGDVPTRTFLRDYRAVDGVLMPTTLEQHLPGGQRMITRISSVETTGVDASAFAQPEPVRALVRAKGAS
jgi:hypothetical protein